MSRTDALCTDAVHAIYPGCNIYLTVCPSPSLSSEFLEGRHHGIQLYSPGPWSGLKSVFNEVGELHSFRSPEWGSGIRQNWIPGPPVLCTQMTLGVFISFSEPYFLICKKTGITRAEHLPRWGECSVLRIFFY